MQLHDLRPIHKKKQKKRVARGGKRGTYSGRGMKGQKSRAGKRMQPIIREVIKKYPKLRGYRFSSNKEKPTVVNLGVLEKEFKAQDKITPSALLLKKIIKKIKGRTPKVKILGHGELNKALIFEKCETSASAKKKIEKAKGKVIL